MLKCTVTYNSVAIARSSKQSLKFRRRWRYSARALHNSHESEHLRRQIPARSGRCFVFVCSF